MHRHRHRFPLSVPRARRPAARLGVAALAMVAGLSFSGCDNPACVFGGDCSGSDILGSGPPAGQPPNHAWIAGVAPKLEAAFPSGANRARTTPIVLRFSESMAAATLTTSTFSLIQDGGFGAPTLFLPPALLGDGRLFVLVPAQPLLPGASYKLSLAAGKQVTDLQGQLLQAEAGKTLLSFTVADTDPALPGVVAAWPPDGATNQSASEEIAVVFDRRMNAATVDGDSFDIKVDGQDPAFDPPATPVLLVGAGSFPAADTRLWRWRSVDGEGEAAPLGLGASVTVELSPSGDKILSEGGDALPSLTLDHQLLNFPQPEVVHIVSMPTDAIGIANLDGSLPLAVDVLVGSALPTDELDMFLFGLTKSATPQLASLSRKAAIADVTYDAQTGVATLGEQELNLSGSGNPVTSFFADGSLTIAVRLRRGSVGGPLRLLDADPDQQGVQVARIDVTRPKLVGFGTSGTNVKTFTSDLRDLSLAGRASEKLRAVEVSTVLGDNGVQAHVVASSNEVFVAAPVPLGVIDPANLPLSFTVRIYDQALNASAEDTIGRFLQVGASGPGTSLPGAGQVFVQLLDARTLAPLAGADVYVHEDQSGTVTPVDSAVTDAQGRAVVLCAPAGETLLTFQASGYASATFCGVPTNRVSMTLERNNQAPLISAGVVNSSDPDITSFDRLLSDSRGFSIDAAGFAVGSCALNAVTAQYECPFGPRLVGPFVGAIAAMALDPPGSEFNYSASGFLRDFAWLAPAPVAVGTTLPPAIVSMGPLLDDGSVDIEERALDGPQFVIDATSVSGLDLAQLDGDVRVRMKARLFSLHADALIGGGVAFPLSGSPVDRWKARTAFSGLADPTDGKYSGDELGSLIQQGTLDPALRAFVELRDDDGNVSARRPRLAEIVDPLPLFGVPTLLAPVPGTPSGGTSYDVVFANALSATGGGVYRVRLVDALGRSWTLWRPYQSGATARAHLPDVSALGGAALSNGLIACTIEGWDYPEWNGAEFAFSDLARDHDAFVAAGSKVFSQP